MTEKLNKAELLMRTASRISSPELARAAMEYGHIAPDFKIVNFNSMDSQGAYGDGRYSSTTQEQAKNDIKMAESYVQFLNEQYGENLDLSFSLKNNILEMEIKSLGGPLSDMVFSKLEELVVGSSLKAAHQIHAKAKQAVEQRSPIKARQAVRMIQDTGRVLVKEADALIYLLSNQGQAKTAQKIGSVVRLRKNASRHPDNTIALAHRLIKMTKGLRSDDPDLQAALNTVASIAGRISWLENQAEPTIRRDARF